MHPGVSGGVSYDITPGVSHSGVSGGVSYDITPG